MRRASKGCKSQAMLALTVTRLHLPSARSFCCAHQWQHRAEILRTVVGRRHDFKLIITSATMDADKFAA